MQNRLHSVSNKTSYLFVYEFGGLIRVCHHHDKHDGGFDVLYLPASHIEEIKAYKSPNGAYKYALKHDYSDSVLKAKLKNDYAKYVCESDISSKEPKNSTPCPTPDPMPTTTATGQGIQTESNDSTPCPLITTNVPYDGNGSSGASPLFIDVETTGLSCNDEIVEIAVVDINERIVFQSLVKPSKLIPTEATAVHRITNAMVANAPTFAEVWHKFSTLVESRILVFYNRMFDTRMIYQSAIKSFGTPELRLGDVIPFDSLFRPNARPTYHCLMEQYAEYWGEFSNWYGSYKWQTLIKACNQQDIPWRDLSNHRAVGDAIKTARLYKHLVKQRVIS